MGHLCENNSISGIVLNQRVGRDFLNHFPGAIIFHAKSRVSPNQQMQIWHFLFVGVKRFAAGCPSASQCGLIN
jgi:hypothetical protein